MTYTVRLIAVGFFSAMALSGAANAMTLKALGESGDTCSTTQLTTSTACEGEYPGNDSNTNLDGIFGINDWMEIAKVDIPSEKLEDGSDNPAYTPPTFTSGVLTVTFDALDGGGFNNEEGTWSATGLDAFENVMAVLKGGNDFVAYLLGDGVSSGTWETAGLTNGGDNQPALSHLTLYKSGVAQDDCQDPAGCDGGDDDSSVVPLPAAGWMLIAGLGGLAAMRRRRKS